MYVCTGRNRANSACTFAQDGIGLTGTTVRAKLFYLHKEQRLVALNGQVMLVIRDVLAHLHRQLILVVDHRREDLSLDVVVRDHEVDRARRVQAVHRAGALAGLADALELDLVIEQVVELGIREEIAPHGWTDGNDGLGERRLSQRVAAVQYLFYVNEVITRATSSLTFAFSAPASPRSRTCGLPQPDELGTAARRLAAAVARCPPV